VIDIKYSDTTDLVINEAKAIARRLGCTYTDSRHIFIALYSVHKGVAYSVMLKVGLRAEDFQALASLIRSHMNGFVAEEFSGELTERTQKVLEEAAEDAARLKSESIGTELVLVSILRDLNNDIYKILNNKNINISNMCIELLMSTGLNRTDAENYNTKYVVIASDGVWDVVDENTVLNMSKSNKNADQFCKELVDLSIKKETKDNVSCIVISFEK
jgi:ATP-dependent Clp protease ATP-binding subunit ClpA